MARAYIGLGSNVGNRQAIVNRAIDLLRQTAGVQVLAVSPLMETEPQGGPEGQEKFLNAVAEIEVQHHPENLLDVLQEIEDLLGRHRTVHWGPRTIDLDLLLYDERVVANGRLKVPHARLRERRFVLEPLAAIAAQAVDPITGLTVAELLEQLDG